MTTKDNPSAAFLVELGKASEAKDGVDVGLAAILRTHFFKSDPAKEAVALAKAAILKLASERANTAQEDAHD